MSDFGKAVMTVCGVIGVIVLIIGLWVFGFVGSHAAKTADQIADNALIDYHEFQEVYNTCQQLNTDLGTIKAIPADDKYFASFSKAQIVAAKKQQIARWVNEYNAKSKEWDRALWKGGKLPYQLSVDDFSNYGGVQ